MRETADSRDVFPLAELTQDVSYDFEDIPRLYVHQFYHINRRRYDLSRYS